MDRAFKVDDVPRSLQRKVNWWNHLARIGTVYESYRVIRGDCSTVTAATRASQYLGRRYLGSLQTREFPNPN